MLFHRTARFKKDFKHLDSMAQDQAGKALETFAANSRHASLHVKKMEGTPGIWEMRVSDNYRITFELVHGGVLLRRIGTHNVLRHP